MSEKNSPETLDRVLDAALARVADEPVTFDVAAGKLALQQALRERAAAPAPAPAPARKRSRWLVAAAAVAVLTVGGLVGSTVETGTGPSATASEQLIHAADLAARVVEHPVGPGQYRYVSRRHRSICVTIGTNEAQTLGSRTEVWIPADYRQEWLERQTREIVPEWLPGHEGEGKPDDGGRDEEFRAYCGNFSYYAAGSPDRCTVGSWNNPLPEFVASLPTDPRALYERMVKDGGTDASGAVLTAGQGLLSGRLPGDVGEHLRALALLPGLVVTRSGRTSTAWWVWRWVSSTTSTSWNSSSTRTTASSSGSGRRSRRTAP